MYKSFYSIQFLRGGAALIVVFHHFMQFFYDFERTNPVGNFFSDFGGWGVDVFFVISGFIMLFIATTKECSPSSFVWNRIIRVVPNYWFYTLIIVVLGLLIPIHATEATLTSILKSLFFIPHENPSSQLGIYPTLSVGWTLNYEMFFYSLVAIALTFGVERLKLSLMFVSLFLISLPLLEKIAHFGIYYKFHLIEFALGMFLYTFLTSRLCRFKYFLALGAVLVLLLFKHPSIDRLMIAFLIVLLALSLESFISPKNIVSKVGFFLGDISYSIYLSHSIVLLILFFFFGSYRYTDTSVFLVMFTLLLCLIFTLALSMSTYKLIEMRLSKILKVRLVSQ
uniref:Acyltransferase 3 n=1 Tax=Marinomonas sp. (strain MWYL1) TaxID=400668 RepID=A6VTI6_MARMS